MMSPARTRGTTDKMIDARMPARVASAEGHLKAMPTFIQLAAMLITTWAAGAAIVFALLKASHS